jgi:hypothetical protein
MNNLNGAEVLFKSLPRLLAGLGKRLTLVDLPLTSPHITRLFEGSDLDALEKCSLFRTFISSLVYRNTPAGRALTKWETICRAM